MSFSCKNYDYNDDRCLKLKQECIPGRPGCVLEGRVNLSEALTDRIKELEQKSLSTKRETKKAAP